MFLTEDSNVYGAWVVTFYVSVRGVTVRGTGTGYETVMPKW